MEYEDSFYLQVCKVYRFKFKYAFLNVSEHVNFVKLPLIYLRKEKT